MFEHDRSLVYQEILLDALANNKFGFQKQDVLPLFVKYQTKRQILIDIFSFFTYVLQFPTLFYLRRLQKSNFALEPKEMRSLIPDSR